MDSFYIIDVVQLKKSVTQALKAPPAANWTKCL